MYSCHPKRLQDQHVKEGANRWKKDFLFGEPGSPGGSQRLRQRGPVAFVVVDEYHTTYLHVSLDLLDGCHRQRIRLGQTHLASANENTCRQGPISGRRRNGKKQRFVPSKAFSQRRLGESILFTNRS